MSTVTSEQQRRLSDYAAVAEFQSARRAEYVGFLDRHPFATDAYELGFAVGIREDYRFDD